MLNTPVPAAGEAMPAANLNRRAILTGTVATAAALAATTLPAEPTERAIVELFLQWDELYQAGFYKFSPDDHSDAALDTYCTALNALEMQIVALPARSAADFAAKILAATSWTPALTVDFGTVGVAKARL